MILPFYMSPYPLVANAAAVIGRLLYPAGLWLLKFVFRSVTNTSMFAFRPLLPVDQPGLHTWWTLSTWPHPDAGPPACTALVDDWGSPFDLGLVAQKAGRDVGAGWLRLLPESIGLAFVDIFTPQLRMALLPDVRGKGLGRQLLNTLLHRAANQGYSQVSLAVHPDSPALRFYQQQGFRTVGLRQHHHVMVATLA